MHIHIYTDMYQHSYLDIDTCIYTHTHTHTQRAAVTQWPGLSDAGGLLLLAEALGLADDRRPPPQAFTWRLMGLGK